MSDPELELFQTAVAGKSCALEFGVGGSTVCLVESGVKRVVSVESDRSWIDKVAAHKKLAPHVASGRLVVLHADIGPTREWGYPRDLSRQRDWPSYWRDPWQILAPDWVDLVFVDGRFRVACALNALLMGNADMTIVIHDFWNRSGYGVLLNYLNCACRADTMGVFFPKTTTVLSDLKRDIAAYSATCE